MGSLKFYDNYGSVSFILCALSVKLKYSFPSCTSKIVFPGFIFSSAGGLLHSDDQKPPDRGPLPPPVL